MLLPKRKNIIFTQLKTGYTRKTLFSGDSEWIDANSYCISLTFLSDKSTETTRLMICIRVVLSFNLGLGIDPRD
jgi:hypothetical protein